VPRGRIRPEDHYQLFVNEVRSFLPDPVGDEHLEAVVAAAQSAPTSSNLQAWSVGAIRNRPEDVARELDLPPHVFAVFGLAVGWPDPDERAGVKPRLPQSAVLHRERYDAPRADAGIDAYEARLRAYNRRVGLAGGWTERVLRRLAGPGSLAGRDRIRDALVGLGLPSR